MTRNLVKLGRFSEYCSSYILIFDAKKQEESKESFETLYVKYNLNRTKRFALRTSILESKGGKKIVIKKAVYPESNGQVKDMVENISVIDNKMIEILKPEKYVSEYESNDGKAYAIYPFIEGEMLTDIILNRIKKGENAKEVITEYMFKIIGKFNGLIENYNLDCTFQNVILSNNKLYIIDSEWIAKDTTEVDFLRYRILKYFYRSAKQYLPYSTFKDLLRDFSISYLDTERYEAAENEFQSRVHENINNLDISKYEELNPGYAKLYYIRAELERVREQLERITGENNVVTVYAGDINYTGSQSSQNLTVNKKASLVNVTATNAVYGNGSVITVKVPIAQKGYVRIVVNGTGINVIAEIIGGVAEFNATGLDVGRYLVNVTYLGNQHYDLAVNSTYFNITKANLTASGIGLNVTVKEDGGIVITVPSDFDGKRYWIECYCQRKCRIDNYCS